MGLLLQNFLPKCLLFLFLPYFLTHCVSSVQPPCLYSERSALLQLKESFIVNRSASSFSKADSWKLEGWMGGNCCSWDGVECDENTGHVIGLDLSSSFLYGSIDSNSSLFQLRHLTRLSLFDNDFNGSEIPSVIGNLSRLSQLDLSYSAFSGQIPNEVLQLAKLVILDLSRNNNLSGELLESFGNLKLLSHLDVSHCSFSGKIPNSLANLTQLTYLSLAFNDFTPSTLSWLDRLTKLTALDVRSTNSYGDVLPSLKNLTRLTNLLLYANQFSSQIPSWLGNLTQMTTLDLGINQFWGLLPESIFTLTKLEFLALRGNHLNGTYKLESFLNLKNIKRLQLNGNKFSLTTTTVMNTTIPKFTILALASCNLLELPNFLSGQDELMYLDLSGNKIHGSIPGWIWGLSAQTLEVLSLSRNFFTSFHQRDIIPPWTKLIVLDLSSNKLQGSFPIPPTSIYQYFISNNLLKGEISSMICNLPLISVLDISNNSFSGMLPSCLGNLSKSLSVLNLQSNNFHGPIPRICEKRSQLREIDLSQNQLDGDIRRSIVNCNMLEFLNLGNNQIEDKFPSWLGRLPELKVVILRHNGFHGAIGKPESNEFPKLRIFDISFNKFEGGLPSHHFQRWKAMEVVDLAKLNYLRANLSFQGTNGWTLDYAYSMSMIKAGVVTEYDKIQDVLVAIDLSSNRFVGGIPQDIQILKAVQFLNLSNNLLSGSIPSSMANLTQLEALDLSRNQLSGEIPQELTQLTFLGYFDVSSNQLKGPIPQGKQFGTFENNSFDGNPGLCGKPLSKKCYPEGTSPALSHRDEGGDSWFEFGWKAILLGFGSGVVNGLIFGYFFNPMKHEWFIKYFGRKMQNRSRGRRG